jgi:hypothetical protein
VKLAAIGDIAEVRPGLSTGARLQHTPTGSHQLVLSRHLVPGQSYSYQPQDEFRIDPGRNAGDRYLVVHGDVLFMSRGTRNVASWIESVPDLTVAPVSFYVLRPGRHVDSAYLTWYLNQRVAQRALSDIRTGAGTPIVQRAAFEQLAIPLPQQEIQRKIGALGSAMGNERSLLRRLLETTSAFHDLTSEQIARELIVRTENNDE